MRGTNKPVGNADSYLAIEIEELLRKVPPLPSQCCIYKVPVNLRSVSESAYTPKLVSIGPLHHGEPKLQPMEVHKLRYLNSFLRRNPDISLEDCVRLMRELEEKARGSYHEDQFTSSLTSNEFVKMMILDGCFIVELFLVKENPHSSNKDDPIVNTEMYNIVFYDMLLLENQLPFLVPENLFNFINGPYKRCTGFSFFELAVYYFSLHVKIDQPVQLGNSAYQVKHFVDLVLRWHLPSNVCRMPPKENTKRETIYLPCATELHESGVKFAKGTSSCFFDITFANGVLEIPTLLAQDSSEYVFRNLIAMEQCHQGSNSYITDYMQLMDFLINTPKDVALLRSYGIIENFLGSDEDVSGLFNNIVKGVFRNSSESHYYRLVEDVNAYYNTRWHVWKAKLRRDYFNNPWAIISLNAALILLICTFVQTICAVISTKP